MQKYSKSFVRIYEWVEYIISEFRVLSSLVTEVIYHQVFDELATYDVPAEPPLHHIWRHDDDRWDSSVLFNTPTTGMDTLQTFEVGCQILFMEYTPTTGMDTLQAFEVGCQTLFWNTPLLQAWIHYKHLR